MKVSMDTKLLAPNDKPMMLNATEQWTLGIALYTALTLDTPTDAGRSGAEKYALAKLAKRVAQAGEVDLTVEEVVQLKERVGITLLISLVGAVYDVFLAAETPKFVPTIVPTGEIENGSAPSV